LTAVPLSSFVGVFVTRHASGHLAALDSTAPWSRTVIVHRDRAPWSRTAIACFNGKARVWMWDLFAPPFFYDGANFWCFAAGANRVKKDIICYSWVKLQRFDTYFRIGPGGYLPKLAFMIDFNFVSLFRVLTPKHRVPRWKYGIQLL
jgi:hypothetical protein